MNAIELHAQSTAQEGEQRVDPIEHVVRSGRRSWLKAVAQAGICSVAPVACGMGWSALANAATDSAPPQRIASLSWAGAQILMSVGVAPLGLTDLADYPLTGALPAMPSSVVELGLHSEPNLELLLQMKPDLIVIDPDQSNLASRLHGIAPTVTIDLYDPQRGKPLARARAETLRVGALLGREAEAHRYLASADARLAENARNIAALGAVPPVLIVDLYDDGRHLYLYGPNSMMQDVMDRLGVHNAWTGSTDSGYLLTGVEGLVTMGNAQMYYISHGIRDRIALHNLSRSALWQHLPFVKAKRFRPLPGFFTYGAVPCAVQLADELTAAMSGLQRDTRGRRE